MYVFFIKSPGPVLEWYPDLARFFEEEDGNLTADNKSLLSVDDIISLVFSSLSLWWFFLEEVPEGTKVTTVFSGSSWSSTWYAYLLTWERWSSLALSDLTLTSNTSLNSNSFS